MNGIPPKNPGTPRAGAAVSVDAQELARLKREIAVRDDILSIAAHELRNPLHALALHLALARVTAQNAASPEVAERIRRAELTLRRYSERVTVLMELLASPDAVYPITTRGTDVLALLETLVDSLDQEARLRGVAVTIVAEPPGAWRSDVDPIAFEQVVDNLLLNAFKHSAATRITIRLQSGPTSWSVRVEDNGHGIAPRGSRQDLPEVRGRRAFVAGRRRSGLGLWIVTRLVHAMDGDVSLSSAPGDGCVFTVRIPERVAMSTVR